MWRSATLRDPDPGKWDESVDFKFPEDRKIQGEWRNGERVWPEERDGGHSDKIVEVPVSITSQEKLTARSPDSPASSTGVGVRGVAGEEGKQRDADSPTAIFPPPDSPFLSPEGKPRLLAAPEPAGPVQTMRRQVGTARWPGSGSAGADCCLGHYKIRSREVPNFRLVREGGPSHLEAPPTSLCLKLRSCVAASQTYFHAWWCAEGVSRPRGFYAIGLS